MRIFLPQPEVESKTIAGERSEKECAKEPKLLKVRSFFHLQPELDQAAIAAKPFAQREATAALSHGIDPLVQSHRYFPFAFSPTGERCSPWSFRHGCFQR